MMKASKAQVSDSTDCSANNICIGSNEKTYNTASSPREDDIFGRVSFKKENFVASLHGCSEKYDAILCLSVSKWIHLNWGDDGLITLFVKIWRLLRPGGIFVLEPQPWSSYNRNRQVSKTATLNFNNIILRPHVFREILLDKIGFRSAEIVTDSLSGTVAGFNRPIIAFTK
ncbi:putative RNA methyltransferase At5g51130 [Iris pallida]|uniref:RNA methyltransferase n=1 Tax=Iris pallida TaxID=29817 RepID=A0AAX6G363_IRIPA|nr:putative RNA methyltransferase At5g51130 [Iris pallida]